MPLGPAVRRRLGAFERPISDAYRSIYISLDDLADTLASAVDADAILEIGCGAGDLLVRLRERFPNASITGIDVVPPGARCTPEDRIELLEGRVEDLLPVRAGQFDLVLLVDVLHHVPEADRVDLLRSSMSLLSPDGALVVKDWERTPWWPTFFALVADRYITGDRQVRLFGRRELHELVGQAVPDAKLKLEARIPPRRNNLLLLLGATPQPATPRVTLGHEQRR